MTKEENVCILLSSTNMCTCVCTHTHAHAHTAWVYTDRHRVKASSGIPQLASGKGRHFDALGPWSQDLSHTGPEKEAGSREEITAEHTVGWRVRVLPGPLIGARYEAGLYPLYDNNCHLLSTPPDVQGGGGGREEEAGGEERGRGREATACTHFHMHTRIQGFHFPKMSTCFL